MTFQVSNISLKAPDWVSPVDYHFRIVVSISFNRAVDKSSLHAPGTVRIDLKGKNGLGSFNIGGTFQISKDSKEAVFISEKPGKELIDPGAGENVKYTISLLGIGKNVVKDSSGETLDGDGNGQPGGNFIKVLEQVG
ncbi:hypothetical protein [Candidatus Leptofilum sp.]|uniref:hypothetical protein n=1 Tax=Candidatus Leptofilum sp. TaxID=3241576 RepID=UPI003B5B399B